MGLSLYAVVLSLYAVGLSLYIVVPSLYAVGLLLYAVVVYGKCIIFSVYEIWPFHLNISPLVGQFSLIRTTYSSIHFRNESTMLGR